MVNNSNDEEQIVDNLNNEYSGSGFSFDWKYDNQEAIFVTFDGKEKKFLVDGNTAAKVAAYMNLKDPKDGATMIWPSGKHKGKKAIARDGGWIILS